MTHKNSIKPAVIAGFLVGVVVGGVDAVLITNFATYTAHRAATPQCTAASDLPCMQISYFYKHEVTQPTEWQVRETRSHRDWTNNTYPYDR